MKQRTFILAMLLLMLPIIALPILQPSDGYAAGRIVIGDTRADIYTTHKTGGCDCCPSLWGGGVAGTYEDLSTVQVGDWADIRTIDGGHYVLECVEITPCIRVGRYLVGWRGVVKADGDIIVFAGCRAYRLVRL